MPNEVIIIAMRVREENFNQNFNQCTYKKYRCIHSRRLIKIINIKFSKVCETENILKIFALLISMSMIKALDTVQVETLFPHFKIF